MGKSKRFSKTIKLVYWQEPNFGDMLSPYIIGKLSGKKIQPKFSYLGKRSFRFLLHFIRHLQFGEIKKILFFYEKNLLGIGSVISWGNKHSIVWGSGFLTNDKCFRGGYICAVRGKYTNVRLQELGFKGTSVLGDPALLIPLLVRASSKKTDIAIIPHWSETEFFLNEYGDRYKIIDLRTRDVEYVISEITSSRYILSTSLHGIIVSHAYGIPALWIKYNALEKDDIKFYDYFSSVDIDIYKGFNNLSKIFETEKAWKTLFKENMDKALPKVDISPIQKDLLRVAPFDIVEDYKTCYE